MENSLELQVMQKAVDKWGKIAQLEMLQEEATELALAARKVIRNYKDISRAERMEDLAGEIADVEILITQVKMMFPDMIGRIHVKRDFKMRRLEERIEKNKFE